MGLFVLIAASDATERDAYAEFLRRAGFDVETADDGVECVECVEKVRRFEPDVLVVAADLPRAGAEVVLDRVDGDPGVPWVPVTLATGDEPPGTLGERLGLPPHWCLERPCTQELLDRVREFAGGGPGPDRSEC